MTGVQKITILGTVGKSEGNELPLKGAGALEGVRGSLIAHMGWTQSRAFTTSHQKGASWGGLGI